MQFPTYTFLLAFLPATVLVAWGAGRLCGMLGFRAALLVASLAFYGWWDLTSLLVLVGSVVINYAVASVLVRTSGRWRTFCLASGTVANLAGRVAFQVLALRQAPAVHDGSVWTVGNVLLPLGLSYLTLRQVAFLQDLHRGRTALPGFVPYALMTTFFPLAIAGPITRVDELWPQFERHAQFQWLASRVTSALVLITCGLVKVVLIGGLLLPISDAVFWAISDGRPVGLIQAWTGAAAFTLWLYFELSGTVDLGAGAARLFGVRLPAHFDRPFQAVDLIDFWDRWQSTLARTLRDCVHEPLCSPDAAFGRRTLALLATIVVGAVFFGLSGPLLLWSLLQGCGVLVCAAWRHWRGPQRDVSVQSPALLQRLVTGLGTIATLTFVVLTVVPWRLPTLNAMGHAWSAMLGGQGLHGSAGVLREVGWTTTEAALCVGLLLAACCLLPDSQTLLARFRPTLGRQSVRWTGPAYLSWMQLRPRLSSALLCTALFLWAFGQLTPRAVAGLLSLD